MIKKNSIIFFLPLALIFFTKPSFGAEKEKFNSTLSTGIEITRLSLTNSAIEGVEVGFESATVPSVNIDYRPFKDWSVKLSASTFETDIEVGSDERFEHYGSFKQTTFSATLLYITETSQKSPFKMYMGGGLSYHLNDIDKDSQSPAISDFFAKNRTLSGIENSLGGHATLGFKYKFSDHLLVGLSLSLSMSEAKAEVTYPDSTVRDSSLSLNAIAIGTGLEYQF